MTHDDPNVKPKSGCSK